jgi:hypothetical protein
MILTVGDSFTEGEELADREHQAWPYLLGQELALPVRNLGRSGNSNDAMIRQLITALSQQSYSLVVVGWTDPARFETWHEPAGLPVTVMPASRAGLPWTDDYYRYSYNDDYALERWLQQVLLLQAYLNTRNQPYLFIRVAGLTELNPELNTVWPQVDAGKFVGWPFTGMIEMTRDYQRGPNGHPLAEGHQKIADEIRKYIRT